MEIEIRAATVQAVELLHDALKADGSSHRSVIEIDWLLWQIGEELKEKILPHHRTITTFY